MKIQGTNNEVLTNSQNESKFTINASAQAFRILSDGLYEHKIAAIVRELSCNAYDAQKMAGREDVPFKIVLPNDLHPYFEVEDEGVGLDDEGVREVYTSYFTSTKSDSNEAIGGFGLGSKTPFAYTTSFNIRARKDNVERLYSAYIGNDGAPCVNLMSERTTDKHDGVRITVPVKGGDRLRFFEESRFILSFFKTKPEVVGHDEFDFAYPDVFQALEDHGIATVEKVYTSSSLYTGNFFIVMGGVCYPMNEHYIRYNVGNTYLNNVVMGNSYGNVTFIKFDIGELEVAASRENLSMDDNTEEVLKNKIYQFAESLKENDQKKIDEMTNSIDAVRFITSVYGNGPIFDSIFDYRGRSLRGHMNKKKLGGYDSFMFMRDDSNPRTKTKKIFRFPNGLTIGDLIECKTLVGVYPKTEYEDFEDIPAFAKYTREACGKNEGLKKENLTVAFKGPVSESTKKRIESIVGVEMELLCIDDMKEAERLARKAKREAEKANAPLHDSGPKVKLKDTTCRGISVTLDPSERFRDGYLAQYNKSDRIDLIQENTEYFRGEKGMYRGDDGYVKTKSRYVSFSPDSFAKIFNFLEDKENRTHKIIVMENSMNTKKLENNEVPHINTIFDSIYTKDNLDKLVAMAAFQKISDFRYHYNKPPTDRVAYSNLSKLGRLGVTIGGVVIDGFISDSINEDTLPKGLFDESMIKEYASDLITYSDFEVRVNDTVELVLKELDDTYEKYPLIFVTMKDDEYLDSASVLEHLKKYAKMIDAESEA